MAPNKIIITQNEDIIHNFSEIAQIIKEAKENAFKAVNRELVYMYWEVGKFVSGQIKNSSWGKAIVSQLYDFINRQNESIKGFSASNIWRMRQFYGTYCENEKLATLLREVIWSNNLTIMARVKSDEAREFYLRLCIKTDIHSVNLIAKLIVLLFERTMILDKKNELFISKNTGLSCLRDNYLGFLDLPQKHKEKELRESGEEYRIQVRNFDFFIHLLFYNRGLSCLVAIELKTEHLGQLNFYFEALDRDIKKRNENPNVGLILCTGKDDTVVEYSLSRNLSPTLIADYKLYLPNKELLENKLRGIAEFSESEESNEK
ncbi:MAG: PDDEXK nuclease domain-containing protein [Oscillospiraceae bacterium]|nr:PDDEXK nuclease domain-containing protein [Oscillospiraceae bacterium]